MKKSPFTPGSLEEAGIVPGGYLERLLTSVLSRSRHHQWNCYLRACRRIPASSPLHGSVDRKRIDARRCAMLKKDFHEAAAREAAGTWSPAEVTWFDTDPECVALQGVCDADVTGDEVVNSFLMHRRIKRLLRALAETDAVALPDRKG